MSINSSQIEAQLKANYQEYMRIQKQLVQTGVNSPLHKQLSGRLDMLKKAQDYWAGQYQKLTGKYILATPMQVVATANNASPPNIPVKPITPVVPVRQINPDHSAPNTLDEWNKMRSRIKSEMLGNPNYIKVQNYLDNAEKLAGDGVPHIPTALIFGRGRKHGQLDFQDYNGQPFINSYFEDDEAVIIYQNGVVLKPVPDSLYVNLGTHSQLNFPSKTPEINMNMDEMNKALNAIGGK